MLLVIADLVAMVVANSYGSINYSVGIDLGQRTTVHLKVMHCVSDCLNRLYVILTVPPSLLLLHTCRVAFFTGLRLYGTTTYSSTFLCVAFLKSSGINRTNL